MIYVINLAKFGDDRSLDWSGEQSNISVLPFFEKSSMTPPCVAAHAVIKVEILQ